MNSPILQPQYEVKKTEEGYFFTTSNGEEYFVYFLPVFTLFEGTGFSVYSFNIERTNGKTDKTVRKQDDISDTIAHILIQFFAKQQNAVITQCETMDGRQDARARLFDFWFERYGDGQIQKLSEKIKIDGNQSTTFSIYFNPKDSNVKLLIDRFMEYVLLSTV